LSFFAPFLPRLGSKFPKSANMTPKNLFFKKIILGSKGCRILCRVQICKKKLLTKIASKKVIGQKLFELEIKL